MAQLKEKCPHYDPVTREQVKPGKACPDYITPKGCRYAHPFEASWDGDTTPFRGPPSTRNPINSAPPNGATFTIASNATGQTPTTLPSASNGIERASTTTLNVFNPRAEDGMDLDSARPSPRRDVMEVDSQELVRYNPEPELHDLDGLDVEPTMEKDENVPEEMELVEHQAMMAFINHIIVSLYQAHTYDTDSTLLKNYKEYYKATRDEETSVPLKQIVTRSNHDTWVDGKSLLEARVRERQTLMDGWTDSLINLEGEDGVTDQDGMEETKPVTFDQSLRERRKLMQRGVNGQRLVDVLTMLDDTQHLLESTERKKLGSATERPLLSSSEDQEMRDDSPSSDQPRMTFDSVSRKLIDISGEIEAAERWVNETYLDEFTERMEERVSRYLTELQKETGGAGVDPEPKENDGEDPIGQLRGAKQKAESRLGSCRTFLNVLSDVPAMIPKMVVARAMVEQTTSSIKASERFTSELLQRREELLISPTTLQSGHRMSLITKTKANIMAGITSDPTISNGLFRFNQKSNNGAGVKHTSSTPVTTPTSASVPTFDLPIDLGPAKTAIEAQHRSWLTEYDQLKKQAMDLTRPIVERTKAQIGRLEKEGRERLGADGGEAVGGNMDLGGGLLMVL